MIEFNSRRQNYSQLYYPHLGYKAYQREVAWTEGALLDLFPAELRQVRSQFERVRLVAKVGVTALCCLVALKLHRLPGMRALDARWPSAVGLLKVGLACGSVYKFNKFVDGPYREEFEQMMYEDIRESMRAYKQSGDLLRLNPRAVLEPL